MILVTAANSGNDAHTVDRVSPWHCLTAQNAMAQYSVDPQQVYIGGFSGGSRVALRTRARYPDVFHGALLTLAAIPSAMRTCHCRPRNFLRRFQDSMRALYVTGERDDDISSTTYTAGSRWRNGAYSM